VENGVTCSWAPDGRHFLTATVAPRLRVDNAFYVYKYNGLLVHKEPFFMLLGADWVPAPEGAPAHPKPSSKPSLFCPFSRRRVNQQRRRSSSP
jgi:uncharacterized protein with WD repeat